MEEVSEADLQALCDLAARFGLTVQPAEDKAAAPAVSATSTVRTNPANPPLRTAKAVAPAKTAAPAKTVAPVKAPPPTTSSKVPAPASSETPPTFAKPFVRPVAAKPSKSATSTKSTVSTKSPTPSKPPAPSKPLAPSKPPTSARPPAPSKPLAPSKPATPSNSATPAEPNGPSFEFAPCGMPDTRTITAARNTTVLAPRSATPAPQTVQRAASTVQPHASPLRGSVLADPAIATAYKKYLRGRTLKVNYCKKPKGAGPGRGSGGYDLMGALGMTKQDYNAVRNIVKVILSRTPEIDMDQPYTLQRPKWIIPKVISERVAPIFPKFDCFAADDHWALDGFVILVLRSSRNQYLNAVGREGAGGEDEGSDNEGAGNEGAGNEGVDDTGSVVVLDDNSGADATSGTSKLPADGWGYEDVSMRVDDNLPPPQYGEDDTTPYGEDAVAYEEGEAPYDEDAMPYGEDAMPCDGDDDGTAHLTQNMSILSVHGEREMDVDPASPPPTNFLPDELSSYRHAPVSPRARGAAPTRTLPKEPTFTPQIHITVTATATATSKSASTATSTATGSVGSNPTVVTTVDTPEGRKTIR
ncbi:hypothetical protein FS749_015496 [Ceratobasidium sp. UAMH 11750]|nr:hypothetical protein FS749_015496 [Ceratobasidium sp. UAMH 11750]